MSYTYNGNQATQITDAATADGFPYGAGNYACDANGNVKDEGSVRIAYNLLNLPQKVSLIGQREIRNTYAADGRKLLTIVKEGNQLEEGTKYYNGNLVFDKDRELEYILFDEGRILHDENDNFTYEYHLKDHLGSTRVAFVPTDSGKVVVQETAYYPSGSPIAALSFDDPLKGGNRYKREGKEYIDDFDWNKYDFGARTFDTWSLRSLQLDPMSEKYYSVSPYALWGGNPVRYIDPDGKFPIDIIWDVGNVLWDIGAAVVNHIKGDHKAARSNWANLGMDAAATLIPYVPAGASKAFKAADKAVDVAKAVDKGNDARKATTITENAAKGKAFEKQVGESLGNNKTSQVTIEAADGTRTKVDFVQKTEGKVTLTEAKGSQTAPLTGNQKAAHPQIETSGGTVRGNKGVEIGLPAGTTILPTKVEVIRPQDLLRRP